NRIDSPVSAAQGYDSIYLLAAAIKQAGTTDGTKVRAALETLNTKVEGVVMVYDKPFTHDDHEAISPNVPVIGEVKGGRVVFAYDADKQGGGQLRAKQTATTASN